MENKTLYEATLALIERNPLSKAKTCREAGIGLRWYFKLINNETEDPGVHRIQAIHDYLEANERAAKLADKKAKSAK